MKTFSLIIAMMFCLVLLQAQTHEIASPAKDSARSMETQTISLSQGWTGISSYLDPADPDVALLMEAIQEQLVILMDIDGNYYQPSGKSPLINWDFTKGYYIKLASEETLEITGLYPLNKQLDLQTGWNLIPVLNDVPITIENYFAGNLSEVEIMTEVAGLGVYWPAHGINTIPELFPGKAYLIKAYAPFSLFELPDVTTAPVTDITSNSAVSGGEVISEGSSPVTVRGVVWSTLENPTVEDNEGITLDGPGAGTFVSEVTGLLSETTYFLRAYATSDEGTAYGDQEVFLSGELDFKCGDLLVDSRDGKAYQTAHIGTQCWMAENLNVGTFISGDYGNDQTNNGIIEKYCYNNDGSLCDAYGGLYQWHEMMDYTDDPGVQGICPEGWHIPTEDEFLQLRSYVANTLQGRIVKSCRQVDAPLGGDCDTDEHPRWNNDGTHYGTDDFGFSALPGGNRYMYGGFYNLGTQAYWWTSNAGSSIYHALYYGVTYNQDGLPSYAVNWYKTDGYSVRCVKVVPLKADAPTVITSDLSDITDSTAICTGEVTEIGTAPVTERGAVWSSYPNPTLDNNEGITNNGTGSGMFWSYLAGLVSGTTYYVRAYAINYVGTAYGEEIVFKAEVPFTCGFSKINDIDSNQYNTVKINDQCWMQENLKSTKYNDGTPIDYPGDDIGAWVDNFTGAYAWYDNDISWKDSYGALYNWYAVNNTSGLCPTGWHVPDDPEWTAMIDFIGGMSSPSGNKLKSCRQVDSPLGGDCNTEEHPRWNHFYGHFGTDDYNFSALPAGDRNQSGIYNWLGTVTRWWSATDETLTGAMLYGIVHSNGLIYSIKYEKKFGQSVRCIKDEFTANSSPLINTIPVTDITTTSAVSGGNVIYSGDSEVTARGIVWNTGGNPTVDDNDGITLDGTGTGEFTSNLTGLDHKTFYYVRAYATNSEGTFYGTQVGFKTATPPFSCGTSAISDIDGNEYATVQIGDQCWMSENLKVTSYQNGVPIDYPHTVDSVWQSNTNGAYAWQENDISWKEYYGALYNWFAVNNPNGLCPAGWHVPNNEDWYELTDFAGGIYHPHGNKLKSCRQIGSPLGGDCDTEEHPRWEYHSATFGTDDFNFSALPGGFQHGNGSFSSYGVHGGWWSATSTTPDYGWNWLMDCWSGQITIEEKMKNFGFSVRCLED